MAVTLSRVTIHVTDDEMTCPISEFIEVALIEHDLRVTYNGRARRGDYVFEAQGDHARLVDFLLQLGAVRS